MPKLNASIYVKMTPYGRCEKIFMDQWKDIKERIKATEISALLYDITGYTTATGKPYTAYVISGFESYQDFTRAYYWLHEYFFLDEYLILDEDEIIPEVTCNQI